MFILKTLHFIYLLSISKLYIGVYDSFLFLLSYSK